MVSYESSGRTFYVYDQLLFPADLLENSGLLGRRLIIELIQSDDWSWSKLFVSILLDVEYSIHPKLGTRYWALSLMDVTSMRRIVIVQHGNPLFDLLIRGSIIIGLYKFN